MRPPLLLIWILSGVLFGISFVLSPLYWCFLPAFVFFLYAIKCENSYKRLFLYGWLVGSLHYAGAFFWVWSSFPIMWMAEANPALQFAAIGYYWVITSAAVGLGGGIAAVAIKKIARNTRSLIVFVPVAWVLSEIVKSVVFSIYAFGNGGLLNAGFSYGYLGYLLAENELTLMLAKIAGVYGLSYVASLLCVLVFIFFAEGLYKKKTLAVVAAIMVVSVIATPLFLTRAENKIGKEVISFEAYFDREFLAQENATALKNAEVKEAMALALRQDVDVIVTPEDVRWSDSFETTADLFAWVKEQTDSKDVIIVDTGPAVDARGKNVIRAYMYDLSTESIYFFDKKFLVPQGEFLSYVHELGLSLIAPKEQMEKVYDTVRFKAGVMGDSKLLPQHLPGVLFCFETMVPYGVLKAASYRKPDFIVHPISHAWFTDPSSLEYQLHSMLKVHAVWNTIPIVTSGSMTESKMYLPSGEMKEGEVIQTTEHLVLKKFSL